MILNPKTGGWFEQSGDQRTGRGGNRLCGERGCRYGGSRGECRLEQ